MMTVLGSLLFLVWVFIVFPIINLKNLRNDSELSSLQRKTWLYFTFFAWPIAGAFYEIRYATRSWLRIAGFLNLILLSFSIVRGIREYKRMAQELEGVDFSQLLRTLNSQQSGEN